MRWGRGQHGQRSDHGQRRERSDRLGRRGYDEQLRQRRAEQHLVQLRRRRAEQHVVQLRQQQQQRLYHHHQQQLHHQRSTSTSTSSSGGTGFTGYHGYYSATATTSDETSWYQQWKSQFYKSCGSDAAVTNGANGSWTVSEGMGYGMLLAVGNGDHAAFDALWAFYQASEDPNSLMNWDLTACGTSSGTQYAATDADEDVAMALVQADCTWGGYTAAAKKLIGAIKQYETAESSTPWYLQPGDAPNNGGKGPGIVDPSYFATGYWHAWATYMNDPSWNTLADDAYTMLAQYQAGMNNLVPDWGNTNGTVAYGSSYYYDACRTPWRVAVDYAWFGDTRAQTFLTNISKYVDSQGGVAGVPFDKNSAFLGAFALSGIAVSQAKEDAYVTSWFGSANLTSNDQPYFQNSLHGVYLLLASKSFAPGCNY